MCRSDLFRYGPTGRQRIPGLTHYHTPIPMKHVIGLALALLLPLFLPAQTVLQTPNTESILYLPDTQGLHPLVVGLGGSEGGNAWTSDHWKKTRDRFLEKGYAFLAIGYFGTKGTPPMLDKIAIDDVYQAIETARKAPGVDPAKTAIVGGSRGGDLALLLGSYYPDISCIVAIVSSHAVFPGHTMHFTTSCWTYQGNELPFIPASRASVPFILKRDLRGAFETMLKDTAAEKRALIPVERIKGPVLFLSATQDEICPSTPMAEKMMARLRQNGFTYTFEHVAVEGKHTAPLSKFDLVFNFLDKHFPAKRD